MNNSNQIFINLKGDVIDPNDRNLPDGLYFKRYGGQNHRIYLVGGEWELPQAEEGQENESKEKIFADHDGSWDYKIVDGVWQTRKKGSDGDWTSLEGNEEALNKLNTAYPTAIQDAQNLIDEQNDSSTNNKGKDGTIDDSTKQGMVLNQENFRFMNPEGANQLSGMGDTNVLDLLKAVTDTAKSFKSENYYDPGTKEDYQKYSFKNTSGQDMYINPEEFSKNPNKPGNFLMTESSARDYYMNKFLDERAERNPDKYQKVGDFDSDLYEKTGYVPYEGEQKQGDVIENRYKDLSYLGFTQDEMGKYDLPFDYIDDQLRIQNFQKSQMGPMTEEASLTPKKDMTFDQIQSQIINMPDGTTVTPFGAYDSSGNELERDDEMNLTGNTIVPEASTGVEFIKNRYPGFDDLTVDEQNQVISQYTLNYQPQSQRTNNTGTIEIDDDLASFIKMQPDSNNFASMLSGKKEGVPMFVDYKTDFSVPGAYTYDMPSAGALGQSYKGSLNESDIQRLLEIQTKGNRPVEQESVVTIPNITPQININPPSSGIIKMDNPDSLLGNTTRTQLDSVIESVTKPVTGGIDPTTGGIIDYVPQSQRDVEEYIPQSQRRYGGMFNPHLLQAQFGFDLKGYFSGEQGFIPDYKGKSTTQSYLDNKDNIQKGLDAVSMTGIPGVSQFAGYSSAAIDYGDAAMAYMQGDTETAKKEFAKGTTGALLSTIPGGKTIGGLTKAGLKTNAKLLAKGTAKGGVKSEIKNTIDGDSTITKIADSFNPNTNQNLEDPIDGGMLPEVTVTPNNPVTLGTDEITTPTEPLVFEQTESEGEPVATVGLPSAEEVGMDEEVITRYGAELPKAQGGTGTGITYTPGGYNFATNQVDPLTFGNMDVIDDRLNVLGQSEPQDSPSQLDINASIYAGNQAVNRAMDDFQSFTANMKDKFENPSLSMNDVQTSPLNVPTPDFSMPADLQRTMDEIDYKVASADNRVIQGTDGQGDIILPTSEEMQQQSEEFSANLQSQLDDIPEYQGTQQALDDLEKSKELGFDSREEYVEFREGEEEQALKEELIKKDLNEQDTKASFGDRAYNTLNRALDSTAAQTFGKIGQGAVRIAKPLNRLLEQREEREQYQTQMENAYLADNMFATREADLSGMKGDYDANTGIFRPDDKVISRQGKYGTELSKFLYSPSYKSGGSFYNDGDVVELDMNMYKQLLAAGADLEII